MRSLGIPLALVIFLFTLISCGPSYEEENKVLRKQTEILEKESRKLRLEITKLKEDLKVAHKTIEKLRAEISEQKKQLTLPGEQKAKEKAKEPSERFKGLKTVLRGKTAKVLAGDRCKNPDTIYIRPDGSVITGNQVQDCDSLPVQTKVLLGYRGPFKITREKTAYSIAGPRYKDKDTIYYVPGKGVQRGDQLDFKALPEDTLLFLKRKE